MPKAPLPLMALKDNLLLIPLEPEAQSPGGIVLPSQKQKEPYKKGVVLARGPGLSADTDGINSRIPDFVKEGCIILYHSMSGWDITYDGRHYVIVSWRNCEGMVNPEYVEYLNKNKES